MKKKLEFISSPFSNAAVDLLETIKVEKYKIGSGEVNNFLMLDKVAQTGKPIIISSGLSSFDELDDTMKFLSSYSNPVSILQCTTAYPTKPSEWGLNVIQELKDRYNVPVGFSDHSGDITAPIAAAALGAEIFEFHAVFDKRMFGPDTKASLTIDQIKELVKHLYRIKEALDNPVAKNNMSETAPLKKIFEKSLAVNRDVIDGEVLTIDMLEAKKPKGYGIDASDFKRVLGKKVNKSLKKWDFLTHKDIYE